MQIYFAIVIRGMPIAESGRLVSLNWDTKTIDVDMPIFPENPSLKNHPNPRGGARGGRGIEIVGDQVIAANYHTLKIHDLALSFERDISSGLMNDLHELYEFRPGHLWVTSTALDYVFEINLENGAQTAEFWPREMPGLQRSLGLIPLDIDKSADNRDQFLNMQVRRHPSHLHLNSLAMWEDEIYALFFSKSAVVNLTRDEVVWRDEALNGAHNLTFMPNGKLVFNDTLGHKVRIYDLDRREYIQVIDVGNYPWLSSRVKHNPATSSPLAHALIRRRQLSRYIKAIFDRFKLRRLVKAWPLFLRGMHLVDEHVFVGVSPASILQINWQTGELVDAFNYSEDSSYSIHGLRMHPVGSKQGRGSPS